MWMCVCKLRTQDMHYEVRSACSLTCQASWHKDTWSWQLREGGTLGRGLGSRQLSASVSPEQSGQRGHWPCGESSSPGLAALTGPASQAPHSVSLALAVSEWQSLAIHSLVLVSTSKLSGPESVSPNIPLDGFIRRFDHLNPFRCFIQRCQICCLPSRSWQGVHCAHKILGNNKVSGQLENFFRWNPSGTFRNIPWYH